MFHPARALRSRSAATTDEASVYEGGRRARWLKVKQKDWTVEEDRRQRRIRVTLPATS
jgi:hypothetical protein